MQDLPEDSEINTERKDRKGFYRPEDIGDMQYAVDLGDPGEYPYTRGIYPEMYQKRLWTMRQYAGYATPEESNLRYQYLLSQGTTGLSVAFDLPTQIGLDSDHSLAAGEVGKVGVAIDSLEDMDRLFKDIPLTKISTSMTINATASILLALYLALARRRGESWSELRGTIQNDILKEYIARGTFIYPPKPSMRIITDIFSFCQQQVPRWNPISVSGYHIREAGSTAAQEIGFTLANAEAYVETVLASGLKIDDFAPRISFFFNAHNNFLEEVAKFRAVRRMWARLMRVHFAAKDERSWALRFHAQTAGSTLTSQQPDNNVVRVAIQALAAVLGGTQSLHTNAKDEALALPTEAAALLALRTQQIVAHESHVTQTSDPLGGSWYLEELTGKLEREAEAYMKNIRSMGGVLAAIDSGYIQKEIQEAAYVHQKRLEERQERVVGLNCFQEEDDSPIEVLRVDLAVERKQKERLEAFREQRDSAKTQAALEKVGKAARGRANLMPVIIAAVEAQATVGEIANAMKDVFGEHREKIVI